MAPGTAESFERKRRLSAGYAALHGLEPAYVGELNQMRLSENTSSSPVKKKSGATSPQAPQASTRDHARLGHQCPSKESDLTYAAPWLDPVWRGPGFMDDLWATKMALGARDRSWTPPPPGYFQEENAQKRTPRTSKQPEEERLLGSNDITHLLMHVEEELHDRMRAMEGSWNSPAYTNGKEDHDEVDNDAPTPETMTRTSTFQDDAENASGFDFVGSWVYNKRAGQYEVFRGRDGHLYWQEVYGQAKMLSGAFKAVKDDWLEAALGNDNSIRIRKGNDLDSMQWAWNSYGNAEWGWEPTTMARRVKGAFE